MYIKNIFLNNLKKYRRIFLYVIVILIISASVITIYLPNKKNVIKQGKKDADTDINIFNMQSYYTNYQAVIISNKNTNSYLIDEWYKKNIGYRFDFKDKLGNICTYILTSEGLQIKSNKQNNVFKLENYVSDDMNLLSISSYINIYKSVKSNKCCNIEIKNINNEKHIEIIYQEKNNSLCEMCKIYNKNKYVNSLEIVLDVKNIPIRYNIKDKNKNERISIIYNKFKINEEIDNNIFYK